AARRASPQLEGTTSMKKTILALSLAAAFTLPTHAHEADFNFNFNFDMGDVLVAQADSQDWSAWAHDFSEQMHSSMTYMFTDRRGRGRVVKGEPYSADIATEAIQTLTDGNVISHRNVNKVWRDGEGRTRQEVYRNDALRSVYISDPVASTSYTLVPSR